MVRTAPLPCALLAAAALAVALAAPAPPAAAATIVVDSTADDFDQGANGNCTLREAVLTANRNQGFDGCPAGDAEPVVDVIELPAGVFQLTIAGDEQDGEAGDLNLDEDVDIRGAGQGATFVDGGGIDRVFEIHRFATDVRLFDLTVRNGAPSGVSRSGGGIRSRNARLTLTDCTVRDNVTDGTG